MSLTEDLQKSIVSVEEQVAQEDFILTSNIDGYDVPQTLKGIKQSIKNLLNWRNENKDMNPNCEEIARVMIDLNNALAREMGEPTPDVEACDNLRKSFDVLYNNVVEHALVGKKFADKQSNLYRLLSSMKSGLYSPTRIEQEEQNYLRTLCGVNFFQRERLQQGEVVFPNETEKVTIENVQRDRLPESLKSICARMEKDIASPEIMKDEMQYE